MTVFENIKKYSKQRGMNLQTVAERAGLSRNVIYQYNKGVNPSLETLSKIADVLNTPVDNLLSDKESNAKKKPDNEQQTVDINDDEAILTFDGKPIPEEDMELVREILRRTRNGKK